MMDGLNSANKQYWYCVQLLYRPLSDYIVINKHIHIHKHIKNSMKASINGPNRRKNRIGDKTVASTFLESTTLATNPSETSRPIQFKVRSLEKYQANLNSKHGPSTNGDACLFTVTADATSSDTSDSGYRLLQKHLEMTNSSQLNPSDPILIHFHDLPVFILRANPIYLSSSQQDQNQIENDNMNDNMNMNTIYLSQAHCHNHKICEDTAYSITCCSRPPPPPIDIAATLNNSISYHNYDNLSAVQIEVFLRYNLEDQQQQTFASKEISSKLMNHTLFHVLTVNECLIVSIQGQDLVCRVSRVCTIQNSQDPILGSSNSSIPVPDEEESIISSAEASLDEPFRGRVNVQTEFFIEASNPDTVHIADGKKIPEGTLPADVIHVTTSDDEWFPVRRILLAPCLHLTKYVQAGRGKYKNQGCQDQDQDDQSGECKSLPSSEKSPDAPITGIHCRVDIDCCTFDRVLLFVMSQLYPHEYKFALDLSETNALSHAAEQLGLLSLQDLCQSQLSSFASRVRKDKYIRFNEVKARNDNPQTNELLIIVDGMVLDISRWIDEHPGGPSIIPSQALNIDCTCFFEMYHVSRQSFLYLKSFYIGELNPADLVELKGNDVKASEGFLHSLRSYTDQWRVEIEEHVGDQIHKSL